ncbi:MAG: PAC2 family protein [Actinomycetota bacterium]|nr:PAC2 family protein [Actinomycetota bacterium]
MDHLNWNERPEIRRPVIVAAFRGWNDAGEAASGAISYLKERWEASRIASIDPEEFYDFQVARPEVRHVDGVTRRIEWPANEFFAARIAGKDVVLFEGVEPNIRWRNFCQVVGRLAREVGAQRFIGLGAFLADVPHRGSVPLLGSVPDAAERGRFGLLPTNYEGPTGITGVLQDALAGSGLRAESFWAAVPHYAAPGDNPKATLGLVDLVTALLEVPVDTSDLIPLADAWEEQVSETVAENDTLAQYVERLEEVGGSGLSPAGEAPGGEELAAEVERFLRDQSPGTGGS